MDKFAGFISTFWLIIFLSGTQNVFAQKKIRSGTIVFKITNVSTQVPELELMEDAETTFSFSSAAQRTDFEMMSKTIRMQTVYNISDNNITTYYDFSGQKFSVDKTPIEAKENTNVKKIRYPQNSIKRIAGYECHKAEIVTEEETIIFWVTDRIKTQMLSIQQLYPDLKGFPLEYVKVGENTKMTFMAKSVLEEAGTTEVMKKEAYQKLSAEEFEERMGGMQFGF